MDAAKLLNNDNDDSQSLVLPEGYQFTGDEVYVKKCGGMVILISKDDVGQFSDDDMEHAKQKHASG